MRKSVTRVADFPLWETALRQGPDMESNNQAELAALNAITETLKAITVAMDAQTKELSSLAGKVDDVQVRVIRLEEQRHGRDIERLIKTDDDLKSRIAAIELANAALTGRFVGAGSLAGLLHKFLPWVISGVVIIVTYLNLQDGAGK
jgi:hypothetical protein